MVHSLWVIYDALPAGQYVKVACRGKPEAAKETIWVSLEAGIHKLTYICFQTAIQSDCCTAIAALPLAMDIIQTLHGPATAGTLAFVLLVVAVAGMIIPQILSKPALSQIPEIGGDIGDAEKRRLFFLMHGKKLYQEGYHRVRRGFTPFLSYSDLL
jgi:hypothetical protein